MRQLKLDTGCSLFANQTFERSDPFQCAGFGATRGFEAGFDVLGLRGGAAHLGFGQFDFGSGQTRFRLLFAHEGTMSERLADVTELFQDNEPVMDIVDFMQLDRERSICQPRDDGSE